MREYLFLANKVQRQIDWNGQEFVFQHAQEDKYHNQLEPLEISLRGVYHQATSYQQKTTNDGYVTSSKPSPMILCMYKDLGVLAMGDTVKINEKDYFVSGINDVQELGVVAQISLGVNE